MFCRNCGTKLHEGARFCPNCGTRVTASNIPAVNVPEEAPAAAPIEEAAVAFEVTEEAQEAFEKTAEEVQGSVEATVEEAPADMEEAAEEAAEETVEETAEEMAEEIIPEETVLENVVPEGAGLGESILEEAAPEEIASEETTPEKVIPEDAFQEEDLYKEAAPLSEEAEEVISEEPALEEPTSEETAPEKPVIGFEEEVPQPASAENPQPTPIPAPIPNPAPNPQQGPVQSYMNQAQPYPNQAPQYRNPQQGAPNSPQNYQGAPQGAYAPQNGPQNGYNGQQNIYNGPQGPAYGAPNNGPYYDNRAPYPYPPSVPVQKGGMSIMQSYRITAGVMLLVSMILGTLISLLTYVIQLYGYSYVGGIRELFSTIHVTQYLYGQLPGIVCRCFLPALALLILCKPTKAKSAVLGVLLLVFMLAGAGLIAAASMATYHQLDLSLFSSSFLEVLTLPMILLIIMAFVSIGQPRHLVGDPKPVRSRPWKIISGILHLLNGILLLLGSAGVSIYLLFNLYSSFGILISMSLTMIPICIYMIIDGVIAIRTGSGVRRLQLSSAHMEFLVCASIGIAISRVVSAYLLNGLGSFSNIEDFIYQYSGNRDVLIVLGIFIVVLSFLFLWYLLCGVLALVSALRKPKENMA